MQTLTSVGHRDVPLGAEAHVGAGQVAAHAGPAHVARALVHVLAALARECPAGTARAHEGAERVGARAVRAQRRVLRALVDVGQRHHVRRLPTTQTHW